MSKRMILATIGLLFLMIALASCNSASQNIMATNTSLTQTSAPTRTPRPTPTSLDAWVPSDFTRWDNSMAFRYVKGVNCSYSSADACAHIEIYSRYGCSNSVYVEVAFYDDNGTQVDWSNDTTSRVGIGEKALLEFVSFDDSVSRVKITEIYCH